MSDQQLNQFVRKEQVLINCFIVTSLSQFAVQSTHIRKLIQISDKMRYSYKPQKKV